MLNDLQDATGRQRATTRAAVTVFSQAVGNGIWHKPLYDGVTAVDALTKPDGVEMRRRDARRQTFDHYIGCKGMTSKEDVNVGLLPVHVKGGCK